MTDLTIFTSPDFGDIRTTTIDGEPWFVGKDVADILGYSNSRKAITDHVDEEDKGVTKCDTLGGAQDLTIINESGLYSLILTSKLPAAKAFKRWVTHEVIPAIRKTGGYIDGAEQLTGEELLAKALVVAQKTLEEYERRNQTLKADNNRLTVDKQIMQPKADYFDELVDRNLLTNFRETAKQLNIKERAFVGWLKEHKYIYSDRKGKLMPYADKNNGLFEVKECFNEKTNWSGTQTLITPKGRETFRLLCQGV